MMTCGKTSDPTNECAILFAMNRINKRVEGRGEGPKDNPQ
jgi:hypothetical protein